MDELLQTQADRTPPQRTAAITWPVTEDLRSIGGLRLQVAEAGPVDGPLVILLHGFPDIWQGWRSQIEALSAAGYRVLAPNQRGYAGSDQPLGVAAYDLDRLAQDVVALAQHSGRRRFRLVGHDWGGIVAWWTAARHPERVERLAVLNAPYPGIVRKALRRSPRQMLRSAYVALFQVPGLAERLLRARNHRALFAAMRRSGWPAHCEAEEAALLRAAWSRPGALAAMLNYYRALLRRPERSYARRVQAPTLLVWGLRDPTEGRIFADLSLELCDNARVLWLPSARHWPQREDPDAVNAALLEFLHG